MVNLRLRRYVCPHKCGWYREWWENVFYLDNIIIHPVYGRVTGSELVHLDITWHRCELYWRAIDKWHTQTKSTEPTVSGTTKQDTLLVGPTTTGTVTASAYARTASGRPDVSAGTAPDITTQTAS